jgi:uncharacterized membrane protein YfcA
MRTASTGVSALDLAVFVSGSFVAALASQVAGLAYGLVVAAVWLKLLAPLQTVTLIIAFGRLVQGIVGWELRPVPDWRVLWPFLAGATIGVPVGVEILSWTDPTMLQPAIGARSLLSSALAVRCCLQLCQSGQVERSRMPEPVFSMVFSAGPSDLQASSSTRGAAYAYGRKKFGDPSSNMSDFSFLSVHFVLELKARSMTIPSLHSSSAYRPC